jgi:hypothetical protein
MPIKNFAPLDEPAAADAYDGAELLIPLVNGQPTRGVPSETLFGVIVGELIAITDERGTPLVTYPGQEGVTAIGASSVVDLHSAHVGKRVVLTFDGGDPERPIVMGVIREGGWPLPDKPESVEVDADGRRLVVTAKEELILRCGLASITLTKAGKVLIQGEHVSSRSAGVNRIKGGSVQIN